MTVSARVYRTVVSVVKPRGKAKGIRGEIGPWLHGFGFVRFSTHAIERTTAWNESPRPPIKKKKHIVGGVSCEGFGGLAAVLTIWIRAEAHAIFRETKASKEQ